MTSHRALLGGLIVLASLALIAMRGLTDGRHDSRSDEVAALKKRIARLEARVAELERKLQESPSVPENLIPDDHLPMPPKGPHRQVPRRDSLPKPIPPDWERREFNGVPYYIIPAEPVKKRP